MDCRTHLSEACLSNSRRKVAIGCLFWELFIDHFFTSQPLIFQTGDLLVAGDHPLHGAFPWTQQSLGCGRPGDFIYLPYSFLASPENREKSNANEKSECTTQGSIIANQWLRLHFGVFDDFDPRNKGKKPPAQSKHNSLCKSKSVNEVINGHRDFEASAKGPGHWGNRQQTSLSQDSQ